MLVKGLTVRKAVERPVKRESNINRVRGEKGAGEGRVYGGGNRDVDKRMRGRKQLNSG
jgi:hypothetical protein